LANPDPDVLLRGLVESFQETTLLTEGGYGAQDVDFPSIGSLC
jgi:hypothetical protein